MLDHRLSPTRALQNDCMRSIDARPSAIGLYRARDTGASTTRNPVPAKQKIAGAEMQRTIKHLMLFALTVIPASGVVAQTTPSVAAINRSGATQVSLKLNTQLDVATIHMKLLARISPAIPEYSPREGWLFTDGVRWDAYEPSLGVTRLLNTASGRSFDRPDPEGCAGGLLAVGGGELLYECEDPECPNSARSCMAQVSKSTEPIYWSRRYVSESIENGVTHVVAGTSHFTLPPKEGSHLPK